MNDINTELLDALRTLVTIADKMIPEPDGGFSNSELYDAECAIQNAHRLISKLGGEDHEII